MAQVTLNTRIALETHQVLKNAIEKSGISIAKFVDEAIKEKVEKEDKK